MSLTFLIPDWARLAGNAPRLTALETLLARADSRPAPEGGVDGMLAEIFNLTSIPAAAPLTRLADDGEQDDAFWFCANPVHLAADRDQLIMLPPAALEIGAEEARALADTFNRMYVSDGFRLETPVPSRWYLRVPTSMNCVTQDPKNIAGGPIFDFMPSGPDAPRLKQLMTEMQMLLHDHPVNQAREVTGKQPVNTVWVWGGGCLPESRARGPNRVVTDIRLIQGLALFCGSDYVRWNGLLENLAVAQTALLALHADDATGLEMIEMRAARPLLQALQQGFVQSVDIYPGGADVYRVTRSMLRRLWRRRRALNNLRGPA
jgi:hypothetical protein